MRFACPAIFCSYVAVRRRTRPQGRGYINACATKQRVREAMPFRRLTQTPLQLSASSAAAEDSAKQAASDLPAD